MRGDNLTTGDGTRNLLTPEIDTVSSFCPSCFRICINILPFNALACKCRYRCASTMQAMVAIYGLLSLGFVVLAILAGATFINALLVTVCRMNPDTFRRLVSGLKNLCLASLEVFMTLHSCSNVPYRFARSQNCARLCASRVKTLLLMWQPSTTVVYID